MLSRRLFSSSHFSNRQFPKARNFYIKSFRYLNLNFFKFIFLGPNLLLLNIAGFDLNIESMVSGNIQILLFTPMPVSGNFYVDAQELSIKALLGLQKDIKKVLFLKYYSEKHTNIYLFCSSLLYVWSVVKWLKAL
jgi:hypothetical protein